jgi:uncharacterized RDD family membrane protein YckC
VRRRASGGATARKPGPLDRDLLDDLQGDEQREAGEAAWDARNAAADVPLADRVGAARRLGAAALDAAFIGALVGSVLVVTLRWCDLPLERAGVLPLLPTAAFLVLMGLGYLLMFTAVGGQTLGKMAFGIRVVGDADASWEGQAVTPRQAVFRAVLSLPSVLALGAGFIPALVGQQRAVHDRLSHTRVVRA